MFCFVFCYVLSWFVCTKQHVRESHLQCAMNPFRPPVGHNIYKTWLCVVWVWLLDKRHMLASSPFGVQDYEQTPYSSFTLAVARH